MNGIEFFDTNILVYAYDESSGAKNRIAERLVEDVFEGRKRGVVSNQVLSELFYALTEKVKHPLGAGIAADIVRKYELSDKWSKLNYSTTTAIKAAFASSRTGAHFWDSLIAETMAENKVTAILTENEKDFYKIPGIRINNPFKQGD